MSPWAAFARGRVDHTTMRLDEYLQTRSAELVDVGLARLKQEYPQLPTKRLGIEMSRFIDDAIVALRSRLLTGAEVAPVVAATGKSLGEASARMDLPITVVARGLGSVSDALGVLSERDHHSFEATEYHVLNLCIDSAIARGIETYHARTTQEHSRAQVQRDGSFFHELNNAISNARMGFDILRKGQIGINSRTGDIVERSLARLASLAEGSLLAARLEGGDLDLALQPVASAVTEVIADASLRGASFKVTIEEGLAFEVDRTLINSALSNLVQNAVKYSPPGAPLSIRAYAMGDDVVVEVADACGGVPPEIETKLFQPFERGRVGRGWGLGLPIVRQAAEAHGGRVLFENHPGVGCCFKLMVPKKARY
jgi:signal transduction histidine kinase